MLVLLAGCQQGPPAYPAVTGTVKWKGQPLQNAVVSFIPVEGSQGLPGDAVTDAEGNFNIKNVRGGNGLPEGEYKVAVSRRLYPGGKEAPPNDTTPDIESTARESLPPHFSDPAQTSLKATVKAGVPIELNLQ